MTENVAVQMKYQVFNGNDSFSLINLSPSSSELVNSQKCTEVRSLALSGTYDQSHPCRY